MCSGAIGNATLSIFAQDIILWTSTLVSMIWGQETQCAAASIV